MSVVVNIVIAVVVFLIAAFSSRLLPADLRAAHPWIPQIFLKTVLAAESIALMLASKRGLAAFGFRRAEGKWARWILAAGALGATASLLMVSLGFTGMQKVMKGFTFPQIILAVWIYSSVTEEIFVRGWFQTTIADKVSRRAQILLSGALFGSMHASLFVAGVDTPTAIGIMTFTFLLGLITARIRLDAKSLIPATWAHIAFNVGGAIGGIVATIAKHFLK
jgi:membrane protease YdiL (CAAX protease family)